MPTRYFYQAWHLQNKRYSFPRIPSLFPPYWWTVRTYGSLFFAIFITSWDFPLSSTVPSHEDSAPPSREPRLPTTASDTFANRVYPPLTVFASGLLAHTRRLGFLLEPSQPGASPRIRTSLSILLTLGREINT